MIRHLSHFGIYVNHRIILLSFPLPTTRNTIVSIKFHLKSPEFRLRQKKKKFVVYIDGRW